MMFNDSKLCAVSQTQWSASLPTAMFFHHYWLCVFVELVQKKAYDLILTTVDQFNKKRVLLPQTLDISYSGVHGNKKFPTVEGPEIVR